MTDLLIWLAILPSAILIWRVLKSDKVESEPTRLIVRVFVLGALSCFPAAILESIGEGIIVRLGFSGAVASALMYIVVVAGSEEFVKSLAMRSISRNPEFNYTFDGIVYGVTAALGFATLENLFYVLGIRSLMTAVMRGILSVPLHCACGVFMGFYFGIAAWHRSHGNTSQASTYNMLSYLVPILIHGLYDFALDLESDIVLIAGFILTISAFVLAIKRVKASSTMDTPFGGVPIHQPVSTYPQGAPLQGSAADPRPYQQQGSAPAARPYQQPASPADKNYHNFK